MSGNPGLFFMSTMATPENCHHFKHHSGYKFEKRVAILVDGGFYRWRAHTLFGDKTPTERADELFSYCLAHANGKHQIGDIYRIFYYDCILKTRKTSLGRSSKARNLEKPLETGAFRLHQVSVHCITYTLILEQNSWQPPRNTLSKSARFPSSILTKQLNS